jgi:lipoprotein-releasing system ATP-binding protein
MMYSIAGYKLSKSYHDGDQHIQVLRDCEIEVPEAQMLCITGQSGCGKSTLLHILGLLDTPDSGEIQIAGRLVSAKDSAAPVIRNRELGFVFQFHYLVEDLNARENVALPLIIAGQNSSSAMRKAVDLLCLLGLKDRLLRYPNQLSGGEQQRVALARALINEPKLVLADEPTGNLDPGHSSEVWQMIKTLNQERGQTFVIVTHDLQWTGLAHSTYQLHQGKLQPIS